VQVCQSGLPDVVSGLVCLCTVAVDELLMSGAVVSLMATSTSSPGHYGSIAASSGDQVRTVEELEFSLGEGPGSEAFLTARPVLTPDLSRAVGRWPGYARAAVAAGSHAVFAFPMHVGAARFGVLSLHMSRPRSLTPSEIATCLMVTDLATDIVLDGLPPVADRGPPARRRDVGSTRDQVYQAQGMVMVQLGVGLPEALARLRAHAFATGQDLADLAADVLAGRVHLHSDSDGAK
jgi:ANTAR domain/GAF domain